MILFALISLDSLSFFISRSFLAIVAFNVSTIPCRNSFSGFSLLILDFLCFPENCGSVVILDVTVEDTTEGVEEDTVDVAVEDTTEITVDEVGGRNASAFGFRAFPSSTFVGLGPGAGRYGIFLEGLQI